MVLYEYWISSYNFPWLLNRLQLSLLWPFVTIKLSILRFRILIVKNTAKKVELIRFRCQRFFLFWQKDFLVCLYPYKIHPLQENWERRSPLGQFILYIIAWRGETLFSQNMNINECWMTKENNLPSFIGVKLSKSYRHACVQFYFYLKRQVSRMVDMKWNVNVMSGVRDCEMYRCYYLRRTTHQKIPLIRLFMTNLQNKKVVLL